jgi:putative flavoprotein involved in K+ transport
MSRCLTDAGVDHVVLERGRVAERWRSERWDSLRLLTPRWQSRLPGRSYSGPDPDGYMSRAELVDYLERYAASFPAPLLTGVDVTRVERHALGFRVTAGDRRWRAANVVIATGDCHLPAIPPFAARLPPDVLQVSATTYRHPGLLPEGGVLVVGASSTGVQLAAEIHASGRPVTLSVGRHTRLPRTYRGRDALWWLERMGALDERAEDVADLEVSRNQPSLQLVGSPERRTLDLRTLLAAGIHLVGRASGAHRHVVTLEDDLVENTVAADAKLMRLLRRIDAYVRAEGLDGEVPEPDEVIATPLVDTPAEIDLGRAGIRTVVWATGYRRSYPWLRVPVLDGHGEIRHTGGVTPEPGLYVLGLRFLRRRSSSFIHGAGRDAREITEHMLSLRAAVCHAVA